MDNLVKRVVTESKAQIEMLEPGFGQLIAVTTPEGMARDDVNRVARHLQDWWGSYSSYFKGAKMLVMTHGTDLKVMGRETLEAMGYTMNEEVEVLA